MKIDLSKKRLPEANIQAEVYHVCRMNKINCLLDYKVPIESSTTKTGRVRNASLDVVLYDKDFNIVCIIEVKSYASKYKKFDINSKKIFRYKELDIPIYGICRMSDVRSTLGDIVKYHPKVLDKAPKLKIYNPDDKAAFQF